MEVLNKPKLLGVDLMRVFCIIGVIWYHCACHSNSEYKPFLRYESGDWGAVCVMVFFMISGAMLYYNYPRLCTLQDIRTFYFKRWKSIFPSFYICYIPLFLIQAIQNHTFFYNGAPWKVFISLIGMDGYFHYMDASNYYIIGEWFLGAIILLYLLYPILAWIFFHVPVLLSAICLGIYVWINQSNVFRIAPTQNLLSCITFFVCGMVLIRYKKVWDNFGGTILSVVITEAMLLTKWDSESNANYIMLLFAITLFILLYELGNFVMRFKGAKIISAVSGESYEMFLWQHLVILFILKRWNPISKCGVWGMMILSVLGTIIMAYFTQLITKKILHTKGFMQLEKKITQGDRV